MNVASSSNLTLEELLDRVEELAPLPHVANRIIQVADDDRFSAYDLAAVIATDTAMTAKLLRLANSAYYGFPRRITTVRDSVVLIGFRAVRAGAIAAAMIDLFPSSNDGQFSSDLFWGHSVACALVAEAMAKETGYARPDEAFTVGILHDIGRLVLSQYVPEAFGRVMYQALHEGKSLQEKELEEFGFEHAELGAALAERWSFPAEIRAAIAEHHDLEHAPDRSGLTYVVAHANALCHRHGLWCGLDSEDGAKVHPDAMTGMTDEDPIYGAVMRRIGGRADIEKRVLDFLNTTTDREIQWYSDSNAAAEKAKADAGEAA